MPLIDIRALEKDFGKRKILRGISTTVERGEVVAIIGPSGSGKSTLLRCINGLEQANAGEIFIDGKATVGHPVQQLAIEHHMGMVFQHFCLFPNMTLRQNVSYAPVTLGKLSAQDADAHAMQLLERVNLASHADAFPASLSGGQKQRGAIARTLAMQPHIILLDEPTSALDPEMVKEVLEVVSQLAHTGITMLVVTHEMAFARRVADRVLFLDGGQLAEDAPAKQFFSAPQSSRAQAFLDKVLTYG